MPGTHDNIIAKTAGNVLRPLGFRRKGRSRLWIADNLWWLNVVEFQPSAREKGSFLNVAAHWLWAESGHVSFDYGGRAAGFKKYTSDEEFADSAHELAMVAAREAHKLTTTIKSLDAAADLLLRHEASLPQPKRGSWTAYHAAVAAGLSHLQAEAEAMFRSVTDERVKAGADRLICLLPEPQTFKRGVISLIARQRAALRLEELKNAPF